MNELNIYLIIKFIFQTQLKIKFYFILLNLLFYLNKNSIKLKYFYIIYLIIN